MKQQEEIDIQRKQINRQKNEIENLKKYISMIKENNQSIKEDMDIYKQDLKRKVYLYQRQEIEGLKRKLENDLRKAKGKYIKVIYIILIYSVVITILFILKVIIS